MDRDRIFDAVRQIVGFAGLNTMVFSLLRDWVVQATQFELGRETDEMEQISLTMALADIYRGQGTLI